MLANQPVALQLEVYFPYTGTDSLLVSTCQLAQANPLILGMLFFDNNTGRTKTQGRMPSILRCRPTPPGKGPSQDLHGSELHVSSSSSPDF
jgi:hypothetical protein